ncbi:MAG: hypothetical protein U5L11_14850 [Arhodomonas sp.]|nr:hypothetical protein [Arhodomonas sp.]
MLRGLGLNLVRFGDGKAVRIGRVLSVACRLSIDDALGRALGVTEPDVAEGEDRREVA